MELKKEENVKATNEFDANTYQNASQSVFNGVDLDTPYQTTYIPTAKKSGGSDFIKYLVFGLIIVVLAGFALNYYRKLNKYNGTYELAAASAAGMTMTVDEMESIIGTTMYARLEVKGSRCDLTINYSYINKSGSAKIKFDGNDITITDTSETIYGTYDPVEKTISLESEGSTLIFEKID